MRLIYTPDDGEKREWSFVPQDLPGALTDLLEEAGGETWASYDEWARLFWRGNRKSWRAALWVMLREEDHRLAWSRLDGIRVRELDVVWDSVDMAQVRERVMADPDLSDEERDDVLADLDLRDEGPKDTPAGPAADEAASAPSEPTTGST